MKKLTVIVLTIFACISAFADRTFSFGQISCYSPQVGLVSGGGAVISLTVGDDYIIMPLYGKLHKGRTNYDGSVAYFPSSYSGTPMAQLQCVLLSADLQRMEEHMTTTYGGMTCQMINTYTNAGEDNGRYADSYSEGWLSSQDSSRDRETKRNSSKTCSLCGGTGVNKTPNSGGSRTNWVAYYNQLGVKCPYCGSYTGHYHDRCSRCNTPR